MWKLLRNAVLAAVLLAGALKLLVWYEVRQEGVRLTALLAPYAQVHYDSIGAGLNGDVDLNGVVVTIPAAHAHDVYRADQVSIETPGVFWVLQRVLSSDNTLPPHLAIDIHGLHAPTSNSFALFDASWLSPLSLVPFETLGCGVVSRFSVADYQRMGLNPGNQRQHLEYRYDAAASTLDFSATLSTAPFSTITLRGELQRFNPMTLQVSSGTPTLHFGQLAADYADDSYLAKRNRFCAQMSNITPAQFVDQHVAAVNALLAQYGIVPNTDLAQLYRTLVESGGHLGVLSLPSATFDTSQLLTDSPEEVLRELNITTRLNDAPPVMFRLAFNRRSDSTSAVADVTHTATESVGDNPTDISIPNNPAARTSAPPPMVVAAEKSTTSVSSIESRPAPGSEGGTESKTASVAKTSPELPIARVTQPASSPLEQPAATPSRTAAANVSPEVLPSSPPPPADSTLALVWKPILERLPEPVKKASDHDLIDYTALGDHVGSRVRLLTTLGNRVEGRVLAVDNVSVHLRLNNTDGTAELQMPRESIREIRILRGRADIPATD